MKTKAMLLITIIQITMTMGFAQAVLTQWEVEDGGNGHYYELVNVPNGINWTDAKNNAEISGGYLGTITSPQENSFVVGLISSVVNPDETVFIGGFQPAGSPEPAGGWQWVTGEAWSYTNWHGTEPSNHPDPPGEDFLEIKEARFGRMWNDISDLRLRNNYLVEYTVLPPVTIMVPVDIKPTSCPNPLNTKSKGVLPVAVLGTEELDVSTIDVASIRLEGIAPIRSSIEDVATPLLPKPSGPIAYWSFDDPNDPGNDDSGNGHQMILNNPIPENDALRFDGNDYAETPDDGTLSGMSNLTVACWFNANQWEIISGEGSYLVSKDYQGDGINSTDSYMLELTQNGSGEAIIVAIVWGSDGSQSSVSSVRPELILGQWNHVAFTYDSNTMRLYLNGTEIGDTPYSNSLNTNPSVPLRLGQCSGPRSRYFDGLMDEVRIYDLVLSQDEISALAELRQGADSCDCSTEGPDGIEDLTLKFDTQEIVQALGDVNDGDLLPLLLEGVLNDGTAIEGSDCIVIRGKARSPKKADVNQDGAVDAVDFSILADNWLQSSTD